MIGQSSGYKLTDLESLEEGNTLPVGGKEVEVSSYCIHKLQYRNCISVHTYFTVYFHIFQCSHIRSFDLY